LFRHHNSNSKNPCLWRFLFYVSKPILFSNLNSFQQGVARQADSNAWAFPAGGSAHIWPAAPRCACVRPAPAVFGVLVEAVLGLENLEFLTLDPDPDPWVLSTLDPDPDPRFSKVRTRTRTREIWNLRPGPAFSIFSDPAHPYTLVLYRPTLAMLQHLMKQNSYHILNQRYRKPIYSNLQLKISIIPFLKTGSLFLQECPPFFQVVPYRCGWTNSNLAGIVFFTS